MAVQSTLALTGAMPVADATRFFQNVVLLAIGFLAGKGSQ